MSDLGGLRVMTSRLLINPFDFDIGRVRQYIQSDSTTIKVGDHRATRERNVIPAALGFKQMTVLNQIPNWMVGFVWHFLAHNRFDFPKAETTLHPAGKSH